MRLALSGRQVTIAPPLRKLVDRRLAKLDRVLNDSIVSAQVVLARQKYRHVVEMTVHARGDHLLHGVGEATAWDASLSEAVEKIAQQAHKLKGKWQQRKRRASSAKMLAARAPLPGESSAESPQSPRIVRAARYPIKPMSVEEAALEMGAAAHGVVVFRNANTDAINVLYRRTDGHLGLIEPEA